MKQDGNDILFCVGDGRPERECHDQCYDSDPSAKEDANDAKSDIPSHPDELVRNLWNPFTDDKGHCIIGSSALLNRNIDSYGKDEQKKCRNGNKDSDIHGLEKACRQNPITVTDRMSHTNSVLRILLNFIINLTLILLFHIIPNIRLCKRDESCYESFHENFTLFFHGFYSLL